MSEFDWMHFAGQALPAIGNLASQLPQAIAMNRAVKQNAADNVEGFASVQDMVHRMASDNELNSKMSHNLGISVGEGQPSEELEAKLLEYFREPSENEDNASYVDSIGEGFSKLINDGFSEVRDADVLGSILDFSPDQFENNSVRSLHGRLVNEQQYQEYGQRLLAGKQDENGEIIPYSDEEQYHLKTEMGIPRDESFDFEEIAKQKYEEYKLGNIMSDIFALKYEDAAGIEGTDANPFEMSDNELAEYLGGKGFDRNDVEYYINRRKSGVNAERIEELELEKARLENVRIRSNINSINEAIRRNNEEAARKIALEEDVPLEELRAEAQDLADQATHQQELAIRAKNAGGAEGNIAFKTAQRKQKELEIRSVATYALADSVQNDPNYDVTGEQGLINRDNEEARAMAKNVQNDFIGTELNDRSEELIRRSAQDNGFEVGTIEGDTVSMVNPFNGISAKISLRGGNPEIYNPKDTRGTSSTGQGNNTTSSNQESGTTTNQTQEQPTSDEFVFKELSVSGDPIASGEQIVSMSTTHGNTISESTLALSARENGFKLESFTDNIAMLVDESGAVYKLNVDDNSIEQLSSGTQDKEIDLDALLSRGM